MGSSVDLRRPFSGLSGFSLAFGLTRRLHRFDALAEHGAFKLTDDSRRSVCRQVCIQAGYLLGETGFPVAPDATGYAVSIGDVPSAALPSPFIRQCEAVHSAIGHYVLQSQSVHLHTPGHNGKDLLRISARKAVLILPGGGIEVYESGHHAPQQTFATRHIRQATAAGVDSARGSSSPASVAWKIRVARCSIFTASPSSYGTSS